MSTPTTNITPFPIRRANHPFFTALIFMGAVAALTFGWTIGLIGLVWLVGIEIGLW